MMLGTDNSQRIKDAAVRDLFGEVGFYGMTIGQLTTVLGGDPRPLYDSGGRTVYDSARVVAFREWVDEFSATLKRLTMPPTADTVNLQSGTLPSSFEESLYLFCRSYFGLGSFEACDKLQVSEFILAKKDDYNHAVVDRNISNKMKKGTRQ